MRFFDSTSPSSLERREMQLIVFACSIIIVLAGGLAVFMYAAVFSQPGVSPGRTVSIAFFGFCAVSVLLSLYLLDRQVTIGRLRQQIGEERRKSVEALKQSSADLLDALPNYSSFQDQLSMEYRRNAAAKLSLSVLVITTKLEQSLSEPSLGVSFLGDAAKAISRKLREQDTIYLLASGIFGVILPGLDRQGAQRISTRLAEGLTDAAGVNNRFSFNVNAISSPEQSSSAHDLELAVADMLPHDSINQTITREVLTSV